MKAYSNGWLTKWVFSSPGQMRRCLESGKGIRINSDRPKVCWIKLIFSEKQTSLGASSELKEITPSVQSQ